MTKKVIIDNIKNIKHMEFCIPTPGLYVVTGKNGSGKTTLFTCLSRIKNSNAFRTGFPASNGNDRLDFFSGYIQYEVDGESTKYSKRSCGKWKANKQNDVLSLMGYPQVVNITTKDERVFTQTDITPRKNHRGDDWINEKLNQIFGTDKYSSMIRITTGQLYRGRGKSAVDTRRRNIAYEASYYYGHREDQSILSLLVKKYNFQAWSDPSQYGWLPEKYKRNGCEMLYYGEQIGQEDYPICVLHHRTKDGNKKVLFNQFLCAILPRKIGLKLIESRKQGG